MNSIFILSVIYDNIYMLGSEQPYAFQTGESQTTNQERRSRIWLLKYIFLRIP